MYMFIYIYIHIYIYIYMCVLYERLLGQIPTTSTLRGSRRQGVVLNAKMELLASTRVDSVSVAQNDTKEKL